MTLAKRLLLGSLVLVCLLVAAIVALSGSRLERRLVQEATAELTREARLIGLSWKPGVVPDALADSAGVALQRRVTLINSLGVVVGDSRFNGEELQHLENHSSRPEVVAARRGVVAFSAFPGPNEQASPRHQRHSPAPSHPPSP